MAIERSSKTQRVIDQRERFVARGIATPPLVVARAEGATIEDIDGRTYVDFAGGLGCQNIGHGAAAVVSAIHEQADRYLHQCFMVAIYEPYVEVCRRLAELSPCRGELQKSLLVNSGAEAVENAVKIARAATGRPGVVVLDRSFHGRTVLTLAMTGKVTYKRGFGPLAPDVYRVSAPYPYRGIATEDALASLAHLFKTDVDPASVACLVIEPVQGEGGFIPMPGDFLHRIAELCRKHGIVYVDDEVQAGVGRTGRVWAVEHHGVEPDLLVSGKSLGGGLPLAAVTGRAELVDAVEPGGLGSTFGGNPLACVAALSVLDEVATDAFRDRAEAIATRLRSGLDDIASRVEQVGEVRGLGPMLALELVESRDTKRPADALAAKTVEIARDNGLLVLSCGLDANVLRVLVPLAISDSELDHGLEVLGSSLTRSVDLLA